MLILAKAAMAAGANVLFFEVHPELRREIVVEETQEITDEGPEM